MKTEKILITKIENKLVFIKADFSWEHSKDIKENARRKRNAKNKAIRKMVKEYKANHK